MTEIELYNGDCLKVMDELIARGVKVDAVITDPPYELEKHGGTRSAMAKRAAKVRDEIEFIAKGFDYNTVFDKLLKLCNIPNLILFCSNNQIAKTMSYFENKNLSTTLCVWKKTNPSPLCNGKHISDLEYVVYVRAKGAPWNNEAPLKVKYKEKCYPFVSPKEKQHPTQKPLELMKEYVLLHSLEGQTVLDPFMGSGTTGEACKKLNRNFIGIEIDNKYFEIAKNRMENVEFNLFGE